MERWISYLEPKTLWRNKTTYRANNTDMGARFNNDRQVRISI